MGLVKNMEIGRRLGLALFASLLLAALMAANSVWKSAGIEENARSAFAIPLTAERLVSDWRGNLTGSAMRTTVMVESKDAALAALFAANAAASTKRNTELMKQVEGLLNTEQEKILFANIIEIRAAYHAAQDAVLKLKADGRTEDAMKALEKQFLPLSQRYQKAVSDLLQLQRQQLNEESLETAHAKTSGRPEIIALAVLAFLAGAGFCWWLKGGINGSSGAPSAIEPPSRSGAPARASAMKISSPGHDQAPPACRLHTLDPAFADAGSESAAGTSKSANQWEDFYNILA